MRLIGTVLMNDDGRPDNVFCNGFRPKPEHLRHEVFLTDFFLCYPDAVIVRGPFVDRTIRPDGEMTIGVRRFFVEFDTGSESLSFLLKRRWPQYAGVTDFLLWITLTEKRRDAVMKRCKPIEKIALFSTLAQVMAEPAGKIWIDAFGNSASIVPGVKHG